MTSGWIRRWQLSLSTLLVLVVLTEIPLFLGLYRGLRWNPVHASFITVGGLLGGAFLGAYFFQQLRFSVKALLLALTVVCIYFGLIGLQTVRSSRAKNAVSKLRQFGGTVIVKYEYEMKGFLKTGSRFHFGVNNAPQISVPPPGPEWLRELMGDDFFSDVEYICFLRSDLSDEDLKLLESLPSLSHVSLSRTLVTEKGLKWLSQSRPDVYVDYEPRPSLAARSKE